MRRIAGGICHLYEVSVRAYAVHQVLHADMTKASGAALSEGDHHTSYRVTDEAMVTYVVT